MCDASLQVDRLRVGDKCEAKCESKCACDDASLQVDRLYGWKTSPDLPIRDAFKLQKDHVNSEFEQRSSQVFLQLNEQV